MSAKILEKILFVDDDVNLLQAVKRRYRKKFNIVTASSAKEGLEMLASNQFAVVVSDLQMPEMNGIEFLAKVREEYPDVTRVMLTGNADLKAAIDAVNNGHIFRFCTKPCPVDVMINTLWSAIEQYRLVNAERELLEKTLLGSVKVLTDILALVNTIAFGRASRVTNYVKKITRKLALKDVWKFEIAAMLSQIGCVTLPGEALEKVYRNQELGEEEKKMYESHPVVGQDLISKIPRLDEVGQIIAYQEKLFNGAGKPENGVKGKEIPLGARILKIALDFDILVHNGMRPSLAFEEMKKREEWYDPDILSVLPSVISEEEAVRIKEVDIEELNTSMVLAEDVKTTKGVLLISQGQEVTPSLIRRLKNFAQTVGVKEPIKVILREENDLA
ncbi:MAG TPA: response regulator [Deltaproteobacteria bacterium]|nr:response regulator [Deltaproteobacteria bacterium]